MSDSTARLSAAMADRYRLERELGAGGMATVYLAEDLKHDRKVAIKVLKPELAAVLGAERFVQEIKTTAALSHPHILPLFDSGEAGGFLYYVMPYIQGETIREKLNRETQFGIEEAIRITTEIADALDYAHRHGVIHRDIKPENILLHDGRAMVMDFGIALAVSAAAGGRMTETGLSLGTPHYMSPEQATADKEITGRSDIYSLASVLYEMLAGVPPHEGGSAQQVIMRIIVDTPRPVTDLRKAVRPNVAAALSKALQKLPADRFDSARAFAESLGNPAFAAASYTGRTAEGEDSRVRIYKLAFVGALLVAVVGVTGWIRSATRAQGAANPVPVRFAFSPAPAQGLGRAPGRHLALSPDGNTLVYSTADSTGTNHLFRRSIHDLEQRQIPGTEGAANPFFSYDGTEIGFLIGDTLKRIPAAGGSATVIAEIGVFRGASWGPNGIVVSSGANLLLVPREGGQPVSLARNDSVRGFWPVVLPGGTAVVYSTFAIADGPLRAAALTDGDVTRLTRLDVSGIVPLGVAGDRLVYARSDGQLFAVPFDTDKLRVTGSPQPVESAVAQNAGIGETKAALSRGGTLAYVTGSGLLRLVVSDLKGVARALPVPPGRLGFPRYSPDGRKFAADLRSSGRTDVYVYDLESGAAQRLTADGTLNSRPEWSPGGERILYRSDRADTNAALWWQPADGSGAAERLVASPGRTIWQGQLSPDGKTVLYRTGGGGNGYIWYAPVGAGAGETAFAASRFNELGPRFSPDGRWVAYYSNESGSYQVYVRPFPGPGAPVPVSVGGGEVPVWSRDGRRIFFASGSRLMAASVVWTPSFSVTRREVLFERDFETGGGHAGYDVAPDGKSFLLVVPATGEAEKIVVVRNWAAELPAGSAKEPNQ